jgi:hypothetical protein
VFYDGTSEKVRIDNNGNVGIGTTEPSSILTLGGSPLITVDTVSGSDTKALQFAGSGAFDSSRGAALALYGINHAGRPGSLYFWTGNTNGNFVFNNGNVGIGVTDPDAKLVVSADGSTLSPVFSTDFGVVGASPSVYLRNTGAGGAHGALAVGGSTGNFYINFDPTKKFIVQTHDGTDTEQLWGANTTNAFEAYNTTNTPSPTPTMVIQRTGNVGIGNTAPSYKLDVYPASGFTGDLLRVASSTTGAGLE